MKSQKLPKDGIQELINFSLYHSFKPFPGQIRVHDAMFVRGCRVVFVQCGRGWGKTFSSVWLGAKFALENPGSYVLHLLPQYKQAKKVVWWSKLYEQFILPELIENKNNQDTYYELIEGIDSWIDIDGSDNFDSQRGLKPNLVVADEYREFDPEWIDVMFPNVGKVNGTIVFIGTPPHQALTAAGEQHHYVKWVQYCKEMMQEEPNKYFHIHLPTSDNPYFPKDFLRDEKARLTKLGMEHVFDREYNANIVFTVESQIFKTFGPHTKIDHDILLSHLQSDPYRFELYISADPGTKSTFAVLFMAIDHYTSTPYFLDEIYESESSMTVTGQIVPRIIRKAEELVPEFPIDSWNLICDNAAAWFIEEAFANFELSFSPTSKQSKDKEDGINLLKEIFLERERIMSENCYHTALEFANYQTDKLGRFVKANDHQIDNARYILKHSGFSFVGEEEPVFEVDEDKSPWDRLVDEYSEHRAMEDWTYGLIKS